MARSCDGALRAVTKAVRIFGEHPSRSSLQTMQRLEQRLERAWWQWPQSVRCFMRRERVKAVLLVDQLRLIRKQHCIAIKSDSQLVGVTAGRLRGLRVYPRGRTFGIQCAKYVALISGQEQIGFERFEVSVGLRPRVKTPLSIAKPACFAERNTRSPETGSFFDKTTTSTRCCVGLLNPNSFFTSGNATPWRAGMSRRSYWSLMYAGSPSRSNTRFSSSKSKSAREEMATTSLLFN